MLRSMFARLMAMMAAVILLCVLLLLAVFAYAAREAQVQARLEALKVQAYDIAVLSGTTAGFPDGFPVFGQNPGRALLARKIRSVYEEYDAYSIVVDRAGRVTSYFASIMEEDAELRSAFDARDVAGTIALVLTGREVAMSTQGSAGPMFTVAVPWVSDGAVLGAVYIQTAAQSVRASYSGLWRQAALAALASFLLAGALVFFFARRLTRPLERIAGSAAEMAGLPQEAVAEGGGMRELEALSASITGMGKQIAATERTRRDFIANLSHELRSPMTSIQGFIRGMLDGTVPEADRERTLGVVLEETRRMNRLVSGLLDLSRAEAGQPRETHAPFNVCEVARRAAITKVGRLEEKRLNLHTDFERDGIYAMGVADQIEQVLINLVDNAIRFTPEGGNIHIGIREQGELVEVTVRDDGIGVAPQDAERVFERFYTGSPAHTAGEGVGLGLAISKAIIEQHGQTIRLLPDGPGAAFRFTLQKAPKPAAKHRAGHEGDKSNGNQHDH